MTPTIDQIAAALLFEHHVPVANVQGSWDLIKAELDHRGPKDAQGNPVQSDLNDIAVLATIRVECPLFVPQREYGNTAYFTTHYENNLKVAKDLGNTQPGDGAKYCGRGYIQLTGRANYTQAAKVIGAHLVENPDLALEPHIAARIFAIYWTDRKIRFAAEQRNWEKVRREVNGGLNDFVPFLNVVDKLLDVYQLPKRAFPQEQIFNIVTNKGNTLAMDATEYPADKGGAK